MKRNIAVVCWAGLLGLPLLAPNLGQAQPSYPATPVQTRAMYSDSQLESFVRAARRLARISRESRPRHAASLSRSEQQKRTRQLDAAMAKAVREEGLSVQEYNAIHQAIQTDAVLLRRVQILAAR